MRVKSQCITLTGHFVRHEDTIRLALPQDTRKLCIFTLDAAHKLVPVLTYDFFNRCCKRELKKMAKTGHFENPFIKTHVNMMKLFNSTDNGIDCLQQETVIDPIKFSTLLSLLNLNISSKVQQRYKITANPEKLYQLYTEGGFKPLYVECHGHKCYAKKEFATDNCITKKTMEEYIQWLAKPFTERMHIALPDNDLEFELLNTDLLSDPGNKDILDFWNTNDSFYLPEPSTSVGNSSLSQEMTFLYNKKRSRSESPDLFDSWPTSRLKLTRRFI